jgi:hypothetical protein
VGSNPTPATNYGRFSRLRAYAQAADQHVWSAAAVFMGTVCGDLLSPCVCSMCRVAGQRAAGTLRFCNGDEVRAEGCIGMPSACLCGCPTQSRWVSPRLDLYWFIGSWRGLRAHRTTITRQSGGLARFGRARNPLSRRAFQGKWSAELSNRLGLHFARFARSSKVPWFCTETTPAMFGGVMA